MNRRQGSCSSCCPESTCSVIDDSESQRVKKSRTYVVQTPEGFSKVYTVSYDIPIDSEDVSCGRRKSLEIKESVSSCSCQSVPSTISVKCPTITLPPKTSGKTNVILSKKKKVKTVTSNKALPLLKCKTKKTSSKLNITESSCKLIPTSLVPGNNECDETESLLKAVESVDKYLASIQGQSNGKVSTNEDCIVILDQDRQFSIPIRVGENFTVTNRPSGLTIQISKPCKALCEKTKLDVRQSLMDNSKMEVMNISASVEKIKCSNDKSNLTLPASRQNQTPPVRQQIGFSETVTKRCSNLTNRSNSRPPTQISTCPQTLYFCPNRSSVYYSAERPAAGSNNLDSIYDNTASMLNNYLYNSRQNNRNRTCTNNCSGRTCPYYHNN